MKYVIYEDEQGYTRRSLVKDSDEIEQGEFGILSGPPDTRLLDWEQISREVNNALVHMGAFSYIDLQRSPDAMAAATNVLKRALIGLYKEEDKANKNNGAG